MYIIHITLTYPILHIAQHINYTYHTYIDYHITIDNISMLTIPTTSHIHSCYVVVIMFYYCVFFVRHRYYTHTHHVCVCVYACVGWRMHMCMLVCVCSRMCMFVCVCKRMCVYYCVCEYAGYDDIMM